MQLAHSVFYQSVSQSINQSIREQMATDYNIDIEWFHVLKDILMENRVHDSFMSLVIHRNYDQASA